MASPSRSGSVAQIYLIRFFYFFSQICQDIPLSPVCNVLRFIAMIQCQFPSDFSEDLLHGRWTRPPHNFSLKIFLLFSPLPVIPQLPDTLPYIPLYQLSLSVNFFAEIIFKTLPHKALLFQFIKQMQRFQKGKSCFFYNNVDKFWF